MTASVQQADQAMMDTAHRTISAISQAFSAKVVGQDGLRESLLIGLLADGHILLESVPGLAKTTAARVLAATVQGQFSRIQCTPDLLPSDIVGTQIYDVATGRFSTQLGPVHANILLVDEINRSSAKSQSAMLEAMEERQTTIAGELHRLPEPFLVIATQNPVDQEGTYPLSEAQSDRFLLKEVLRYPTQAEELAVLANIDAGVYARGATTAPVATVADITRLQQITTLIFMDPDLKRYVTQLVDATRNPANYLDPNLAGLIQLGASTRATIAFCKAARARALLAGRNHVIPVDIAAVAHRVLRHRIMLGFQADAQNVTPDTIIDAIVRTVRVP